jgi:hypothetical protein
MSCNAIDARLSHYIEDAASGHDVQEERPREWHLNEAFFKSRVKGVRRRGGSEPEPFRPFLPASTRSIKP